MGTPFNKLQHLEFDYSGREYGVVARTNLIFDQQQDLSFSPFKKSFQRKGLGEDASAGLVSFSGSQKAGLQELSFNDFSFSSGSQVAAIGENQNLEIYFSGSLEAPISDIFNLQVSLESGSQLGVIVDQMLSTTTISSGAFFNLDNYTGTIAIEIKSGKFSSTLKKDEAALDIELFSGNYADGNVPREPNTGEINIEDSASVEILIVSGSYGVSL